MKKNILLSLAACIGIGFIFLTTSNLPLDNSSQNRSVKKMDKKTRADLAISHNFEMTKDPKTGEVPRERLWKAIQYTKQMQNLKGKAAIPNITWTERGPNNVGGRTRAIAFDPKDASKSRVFSAGVAGGLWICDNIYATNTVWTPVDDFFDNMAITTIAIDPTHTDTMYFGTGEGFFNADAVRGDGIWRSTDGGTTWTQLANTTGSTFNYTQKISVDASGNIYAATRDGGIQKSSNYGSTWSKVLGSGVTATTNRAADIEVAANGDLYAAMGIFNADGVYKSTNSGTSWTRVYTASTEERIELACAPSNSNYVYGLTQDAANRQVGSVLRSTDSGANWTQLTPPTDGVSGDNFARNQAWYDLSIAVDPNDETNLFIGGIDVHRSTNSGANWTQISHWFGGGGFPEVHADQHIALFAPGSSDTMLFGHDGGLNLTENALQTSPSFAHQVSGYNVTQFYACAIHPGAKVDSFLAGAQDNGSHLFSSAGLNSTTEVTGGDGAYVHIDQDDPTYQYTSYVYNQYRRSTNAGSSFGSVNFSSSAGKFINPTDYDNDAHILYCSWGNGVYMRWEDPRTGTSSSTITFSASGTGEPSALTTDPNTAHTLYIGTDDGEIWRINNANGTPSATQITETGMSGYVSSIDVEDGDANHLLATFSNYGVNSVWESTNGGTSWTSVEGNLPDMPIRWGIFSPISGDEALLATELGVWTTDDLDGTSTNWAASNTGLANVRTDMLQVRMADSTIVAATHGRGLFSYSFTQIEEADFVVDNEVIYQDGLVNFQDVSTGATSWAWDLDNDGTIDATTKDVSWTYSSSGYKTVKLIINGSDSITKTDYITVIPKLGTPYTVADGGDFESNTFHFGSSASFGQNLWERGTPSNGLTTLNSSSNGWKTDLDSDCPDATIECHLYTPSFNMTAVGTYTLGFRKSMEQAFSNAPYCVIVEYSTDGSATWNKLGTSPDANGTNWYANTGLSTLLQGDQIGFLENANNENTTYNVSSLAGNSDVRFRFVYISSAAFGPTGFLDGFMIDDFSLSGPSNNAASLDIETVLNATATENLGPNDSVVFVSANNKILATIVNLSSHNYGSTTVTIDNAGTSTQNFSTNTQASKQIADKTLTVTPTSNNANGQYRITTYFTAAEAQGWKTNTSQFFKDFNQIKSPGSISLGTLANTVYGSNVIVDSAYDGSNLSVTAEYVSGFSGFGAGLNGSLGVLPLDLISLNAKWSNDVPMLSWVTSSEINVNGFEIQRLVNGKFTTIGEENARGNTSELTEYQFLDQNFEGSNSSSLVYRLKMNDLDGSFEYSNSVTLKNPSALDITIYPSPARNWIHVSAPQLEGEIYVEVFDISGKVVLAERLEANDREMNVDFLPTGTYFLSVRSRSRFIAAKKIAIIK